MGILGHRDRESRRPWSPADLAYLCEHGSRGETFAAMARVLNRSDGSCATTFFRHATTQERGLRDRAIEGYGGRTPDDPDPIVLTVVDRLVGDCFANNVDPRDRVGRPI